MKSSCSSTTTTQFSVSKEEDSNMRSMNFSQAVRRINKTSKGANGCEYSIKATQAQLCAPLHDSGLGSGEHVKDVNEGEQVVLQKFGGRETLKRHREEVAGRVLIPDKWGQEELLKDWIDCSAFEALLVPNKIALARKALVADHGRRSSSSTSHQQLRIESRC